METLNMDPYVMVPGKFERHTGKREGMIEAITDFYDEQYHDPNKQWERISSIGRIVIDLLFTYDILPRLKMEPLTHINMVIPLREGIPFFDVHVATRLQDLIKEAGYPNTKINFIPIGIEPHSFFRNSRIYYVPQQAIDRLRDQMCVWIVWNIGAATGRKVADTAKYLLDQGVPSNDLVLRTALVTKRAARFVYDTTGIALYGFIRCRTGKEVGCVSSRENAWIVEIEGLIERKIEGEIEEEIERVIKRIMVSPRDWDYATIGISGKDKPHIARSYLNQLLGSIGSINTVVDSGISDTDIKTLENYYLRKYLQDRVGRISFRTIFNRDGN